MHFTVICDAVLYIFLDLNFVFLIAFRLRCVLLSIFTIAYFLVGIHSVYI